MIQMKYPLFLFALLCTLGTSACTLKDDGKPSGSNQESKAPLTKEALSKLHHATFAGGCFWCEEAIFESIKGVGEVVSGYAGGKSQNPTYEEVGGGLTGHAEAIEVYYDSSIVTFPTLLNVYVASIDPFQPNGQGPDNGSQYRSIIFYRNAMEKVIAEKKVEELNSKSELLDKRKCAIEVVSFTKFWDAEGYHQDYVPNHPENPYVQHESIPRLKRTQKVVMEWVNPEKLSE